MRATVLVTLILNLSCNKVEAKHQVYNIVHGHLKDWGGVYTRRIEGVPLMQHCIHECSATIGCNLASFEAASNICDLYESVWPVNVAKDENSSLLLAHDQCYHLSCGSTPENETCMYFGYSSSCATEPVYDDCEHAFRSGERDGNKEYILKPRLTLDIFYRARCIFDGSNGWLLIQHRFDGSQSFDRSKDQYQHGFGNLNDEFWIGYRMLYMLSYNNHPGREYKLTIRMRTFDGDFFYANYTKFKIDGAAKHSLNVQGYSGDASGGDSLTPQHTQQIYMFNDLGFDYDASCNDTLYGDWWINSCDYASNLNGKWYPSETVPAGEPNGIYWRTWKDKSHSLQAVQMMLSRDN